MIYLRFSESSATDNAALSNDAKKLLFKLLYDTFGIENAADLIKIAKGGKPYIEGADFDFSDSHTGGAVAVAACGQGEKRDDTLCFNVSSKKIGVDIERASRKISIASVRRIVNRYFTDNERDYVDLKAAGAKKRFLEMWTKKESIVKATGEGLAGISRADTLNFSGYIETQHFKIGGKNYIISVAGI
ncbi:MAG: 4'-phosphopantetheinyl transferase superfamily protein [Clostridia bacterium]|nr:4'-phosphopantetheinyl transferase superfamily protein [Clostridia bacterium]